jgi:hypothetical protein
MKERVTFLTAVFAFLTIVGSADAQFGINRAIHRGVERAVEKKAEEKAEEIASDAIDKAFEDAEAERRKGEEEAIKAIEAAQKEHEEADALIAAMPNDIPEVADTPYTPSESEWTFFAMKTGAVQLVATKDAKGKITAQSRNTITGITGNKDAFAIHYQSEILDAKGKPADKDHPITLHYRVVIKDGIMYFDMKAMMGAIDGIDGVEASGTTMKIPNNLAVGQTLDDASVKMKIGFINCSAIMTEGKCLAIEDITVEAGTFHCHKITQKTNARAMGIKNEGTTLTWYAKGVGAVKTETYDEKNKLQSSQELISNK